MKKRIIATLLSIIAITLFGFGAFNSFNGRNHPYLKWEFIDTDDCRIVYHAPLAEDAQEAAIIAQTVFDTLSVTYGTKPKKRCVIYLSDQDNIVNGAAAMAEYIFVYVRVNDYPTYFSGNSKWLEQVISHEMSHWFLAYSISDWLTRFIPVSMISFPRHVNEGFAMFFSGEPWGLNRGDRFLKAWALSHKQDDSSPSYSGGLLYAQGFAFVRYLSLFYGEDALFKLLKHRSKVGLYDFNDAFKDVYKKSYADLWEEFRQYVYTHYYGSVYDAKTSSGTSSKEMTYDSFTPLKAKYRDFQHLCWQDSSLAFVAKNSSNQGFYGIYVATPVVDSLRVNKLHVTMVKEVAKRRSVLSLKHSANGKWLTYTAYGRGRSGRLAPMVYLYDVERDKHDSCGEGSFPTVGLDGKLYFQKNTSAGNAIFVKDSGKPSSLWLDFPAESQLLFLSLSPDNGKLALSVFGEDRIYRLQVYDTNTRQLLTQQDLAHTAYNIIWDGKERIIYAVEDASTADLQIMSLAVLENETKQILSEPYNALPLRIVKDRLYLLAEHKRGGKSLGSAKLTEQQMENVSKTDGYFDRWTAIVPKNQIRSYQEDIEVSPARRYRSLSHIKYRNGFIFPSGSQVSGMVILSEALGKHLFTGTVYLPYDKNERTWFMLSYLNNSFEPSIGTNFSRYQFLSGSDGEKWFYHNVEAIDIRATLPINLPNTFANLTSTIGLQYSDISAEEENPFIEDKKFTAGFVSLNGAYSLPWRNDHIHGVRSIRLDLGMQIAKDKLGMNIDYEQYSVEGAFSYAPFLMRVKNEQLRTLNLSNRSYYSALHGDRLRQLLPGTTSHERIFQNGKPLFGRYFLRGFEVDYVGTSILNLQNEITLKLSDDIKFRAGFGSDLLSLKYAGVSAWYDYTRVQGILGRTENEKSFDAIGIEAKLNFGIVAQDCILKVGRAWDLDMNKLSNYYLLEFPISVPGL